MRRITIAALALGATVAACSRTKEGQVVIERPGEVQVTTKKDTVGLPTVNVGTTEDTIEVPKVQITKEKKIVRRPSVGVQRP